MYCGQTVGRIKMPLGTKWPRPHCVRWGPNPPTERDTTAPTFRPMSIVAKRSPISVIAELLLIILAVTADDSRCFVVTRCPRQTALQVKEKERKSIYIAPFWPRRYTQSAQAWITQFYLQITPCLPFLRERSPDGATTNEAADIQLQLTTHLSTPKG